MKKLKKKALDKQNDCYKNCKDYLHSRHFNRKADLIIQHSSFKSTLLKNKNIVDLICQIFFKRYGNNLLINKSQFEIMDNSKFLQFTFDDFCRFLMILSNKNNLSLNYLVENINTSVEDSLIIQELQNLILISIYNIANISLDTSDFQYIDECITSFEIFYNKNFFILLKNLYNMISIQKHISTYFYKKKLPQLQGLDHRLQTIDTRRVVNINWKKSGNFKLKNFGYYYFNLLSEYNHLENVNFKLVKQIKELETKLKLNNIDSNGTSCDNCLKFEENIQILSKKYNNIMQNYSACQVEKERMVMKYAKSEKQVIEAQRCVKLTEKKCQDALKENSMLHKKIQKTHDSIVKLTSEINSKSTEILQLRNEIEHRKDTDNSKELQLKWAQNRLKFITDAHKETQIKLSESIMKTSEITNEYEKLRSQMKDMVKKTQKVEENKATILDQQLKEQQARIILERHIAEDSENSRVKLQKEFDLLLDRQRSSNNENNLLVAQIQSLEKECTDYKSKWNILNLSVENKNTEIQTLKNEVSQIEILSKELKSKEQLVETLETEINRLQIEKAESQVDIEAYRQREMQMLDFTQKLTDKNVQLQCEFTDMEYKIRQLEDNQKPLTMTIEKFIDEVKNLEYNLSTEKANRQAECEMLTKYIADQLFYNQKLFHRLEDLEGENIILRKKYDLTIREMTRELHLYHFKLKRDNFSIPGSSEDTEINYDSSLSNEEIMDMSLITDEKNTNDQIYNSVLEKEKLLNQIIKLQKINVKRAEKLDFLEEHSRVLLEELQKKAKIIQDYNIQNPDLTNSDK